MTFDVSQADASFGSTVHSWWALLILTPDPKPFRTDRQFKQAPPPPPGQAEMPDLYTAIQQQFGLKLESTKAPVDVIVIDHVEKPSEN
ncbi:MAG TPA: TIGR03435 family protein [Terriglobia bacterium]|jgi:uncharacterized protein (TIGR03435 family)